MEGSSSAAGRSSESAPQQLSIEDDDSRGESSSSGALSPVPTTPHEDQHPGPEKENKHKPLHLAQTPMDASGTLQWTAGDSAETGESDSRDEETPSTPLPRVLQAHPDGSPGDNTGTPHDHRLPRGADPPPSRVASPELVGSAASLHNNHTSDSGESSTTAIHIHTRSHHPQEEHFIEDTATPVSNDDRAPRERQPGLELVEEPMAPNMPSHFPVETRDTSEESVSVDDLLQKQEQELQRAPEQPQSTMQNPEDDRASMPLPPPRRPSETTSDAPSDFYAPSGPFYLQPNSSSAVPTDIPPPYLAPAAPYGYSFHPGAHPGVSIPPPPPLLPLSSFASATPGRRKIHLKLLQEMDETSNSGHRRTGSFLFRRSFRNLETVQPDQTVERGTVVVSWFEGTSSLELQEHVRKCVVRKLGLSQNVRLYDMRILDEAVDPPEEMVLSAFIPDGSEFLLRFKTRESAPRPLPLRSISSSMAPLSPSAAPSPVPSMDNLTVLSATQLSILGAHLQGLSGSSQQMPRTGHNRVNGHGAFEAPRTPDGKRELRADTDAASKASTDFQEEEVLSMPPEDQIEARLQQLKDLLISDNSGKRQYRERRQEKKQVIFVLANYFVLFLSLIAISAEIQTRAPKWMAWMERNLESVQTCATDQDSLYDCVSNGDFSGLIASFILWFGRSAATKRFFLLGFETPKRLWTVVYEALVTAFCWGISYMFIRRGMNPDTRSHFLQKYWKDAVYGSLAGFNASFLKAVLKNLIPQEALEDALQDRQIKILSWLPSFN